MSNGVIYGVIFNYHTYELIDSIMNRSMSENLPEYILEKYGIDGIVHNYSEDEEMYIGFGYYVDEESIGWLNSQINTNFELLMSDLGASAKFLTISGEYNTISDNCKFIGELREKYNSPETSTNPHTNKSVASAYEFLETSHTAEECRDIILKDNYKCTQFDFEKFLNGLHSE